MRFLKAFGEWIEQLFYDIIWYVFEKLSGIAQRRVEMAKLRALLETRASWEEVKHSFKGLQRVELVFLRKKDGTALRFLELVGKDEMDNVSMQPHWIFDGEKDEDVLKEMCLSGKKEIRRILYSGHDDIVGTV